ncbi:IclR family transcriptional regulator [Nocardioides sp. YIM 152315]|uniref:IclR family transcriptional regulator n=1 Tax=Nocardioides sp. YIM 152315 TaxID=3031760 RepID=UPI0023DCE3A9|nr:IclR family transcriptional regulator [Nocardioides sp. YIM 152315]MDF1603428.1 IclR family transcriptional regulator [Nocardioides sp. YIM 152315]
MTRGVPDAVHAGAGGGVQSVVRAFEVLEVMAERGPMRLSRLAQQSGLPLSTVHRLVATLSDLGYVRADGKTYSLAPRLIHLGERASRMLSRWSLPHLTSLVDELGETANLAMLDGDRIVYVAQVPSRHAMRMFTEVGRRVLPHCTAVGKALLAGLPESESLALVRRTGLPAATSQTLTTEEGLAHALADVRARGYAVDDGEQEVGVRCVAVALTDSNLPLALSVSGPGPRMTAELEERAVPALGRAAAALAADLAGA